MFVVCFSLSSCFYCLSLCALVFNVNMQNSPAIGAGSDSMYCHFLWFWAHYAYCHFLCFLFVCAGGDKARPRNLFLRSKHADFCFIARSFEQMFCDDFGNKALTATLRVFSFHSNFLIMPTTLRGITTQTFEPRRRVRAQRNAAGTRVGMRA